MKHFQATFMKDSPESARICRKWYNGDHCTNYCEGALRHSFHDRAKKLSVVERCLFVNVVYYCASFQANNGLYGILRSRAVATIGAWGAIALPPIGIAPPPNFWEIKIYHRKFQYFYGY